MNQQQKHTATELIKCSDVPNDIIVRNEYGAPLFAIPDDNVRKHIVKCVNSHDELVEALKDCISELNLINAGFTDKAVIVKAKQALKKAGA